MRFDIESEEKKEKKNASIFKKKIYYILLVFFLFFFLILLITYVILSSGNKTKQPANPPKQINDVKKTEESSIKIYDENSNDRPIAFMIDNNIGNGKHAGLQESYINYEIIVEGGLTRIMALYKDRNVELIGPVRSSRHYFLDYALEHDAVYAHFGWSPYAETDIRALNVNNINGMIDSDPFYRDNSIAAPHNVFTSTERLRSYFDTKNYNKTTESWKVLKYNVDKVNLNINENKKDNNNSEEQESIPDLITANQISIGYSLHQNRSYVYDSTNEYYLRSMNGVAHIDKVTDKQLFYKNIIIMKVNNKTLDREGRQDLDTVGNGDGYFITNGYALPIQWSKSNRNEKTIFSYKDGNEVIVNDGNTFIHVVPITSEIIIN